MILLKPSFEQKSMYFSYLNTVTFDGVRLRTNKKGHTINDKSTKQHCITIKCMIKMQSKHY